MPAAKRRPVLEPWASLAVSLSTLTALGGGRPRRVLVGCCG